MDTRPGNPCLLLYTHQKQWPHGDLLHQDTGAPNMVFGGTFHTALSMWGPHSITPMEKVVLLFTLFSLESSFLALEYSWTLYCPFVLVPALSFSLNGLLGVFVTFSIRHNLYQPSFSSAAQAKLFSLFLYSIINHQLFN